MGNQVNLCELTFSRKEKWVVGVKKIIFIAIVNLALPLIEWVDYRRYR